MNFARFSRSSFFSFSHTHRRWFLLFCSGYSSDLSMDDEFKFRRKCIKYVCCMIENRRENQDEFYIQALDDANRIIKRKSRRWKLNRLERAEIRLRRIERTWKASLHVVAQRRWNEGFETVTSTLQMNWHRWKPRNWLSANRMKTEMKFQSLIWTCNVGWSGKVDDGFEENIDGIFQSFCWKETMKWTVDELHQSSESIWWSLGSLRKLDTP
jgi:hypothetical protein